MKKFLKVLGIVLVGIGIIIPTFAVAAEREGWPKDVIIAGTSLGGSNYTVAAAWADMIRKHLGIPSTATTSGGSVMSIRRFEQGGLTMATCDGYSAFQAYEGIKPFGSKKDVSAIVWAHPVAFHWAVWAHSDFKTVKDIFDKGTMQAYPWPASPSTESIFLAYMESVGYTLSKVGNRVRPLVSASDQVKSLRDRKVDALMYGGAPETPQWVALSHEIPLRFIGPTEKEIKWIHEKYPYFVNIPIPANSYKGQNYVINSCAFRMGIVLPASMPESFVYAVTKNVFDNLEELHRYHQNYLKRWYTYDALVDFMEVCPIHPGTVKYLKEKGKWTSAMEERQSKLVKRRDYQSRMPSIAGWK